MNSSVFEVQVTAMRLEAQGVVSVELRSSTGVPLPAFMPGAHIDLHLSSALVRSYSLLSSPSETARYVVGVLRDRNSRGGSSFVHEQLRVGGTLSISAPRNHFELDETARSSVLLAGGIGVTPIFCMYNRLREKGGKVELIYCARTRKEAAFVDALLGSGGPVKTHFDDEMGGPPDLLALLAGHPPDAHFYCCGPAPMLDAFEAACRQLGQDHVHVERFAAAEDVKAAQDSGYQVKLAKSGITMNVPAGKSLLDALLDGGVNTDYSCREGVCGACETVVLEGIPDHRDSVLTERERAANKTMMVCVSGCVGELMVLDL